MEIIYATERFRSVTTEGQTSTVKIGLIDTTEWLANVDSHQNQSGYIR